MSEFDPIDAWFEKGFRIRPQKAAKVVSAARRDKIRSSGGSPARRGGVNFSGGAKAKNIKAVVRKAPEVMVKITGSSDGMKSVKRHLEYISRNGEVDLVNESGETIRGMKEIKGLREQLTASQIPAESKKKEFVHVIFSMPAGTDAKAVREAVADFCREEYSNRRYVMAQHDDTDHSHVHVCISTRDIDRADEYMLSPRKADLFRWRQGFADKLREHGVEAAASERRHRFQHKKAEHGVVRQIRSDNPSSSVFNAKRAARKDADRFIGATMRPEKAFIGPRQGPRTPLVYQKLRGELKAAIAVGARPANPAQEKMEKNRRETLTGWEQVAANLDKAGDRELAEQVRELMAKGQEPATSRNQDLYDAATRRGNSRDDIAIER